MKNKFIVLILLLNFSFLFSQDRKVVELDPVESFIKTHIKSSETENICFFKKRKSVNDYVRCLIKNGNFDGMTLKNTDIILYEGNKEWLVLLKYKKIKKSKLFIDELDNESTYSFLIDKENGMISYFCSSL